MNKTKQCNHEWRDWNPNSSSFSRSVVWCHKCDALAFAGEEQSHSSQDDAEARISHLESEIDRLREEKNDLLVLNKQSSPDFIASTNDFEDDEDSCIEFSKSEQAAFERGIALGKRMSQQPTVTFTSKQLSVLNAAWRAEGIDILGGVWDRFVKRIDSSMPAVPDVEEVRRRFEQEYVRNPQTSRRNEHGDYVLPSIQDAWAGWKAGMLAADQGPHNRKPTQHSTESQSIIDVAEGRN